MPNFYRLVLGRQSVHAAECFAGHFVGVDFGIRQNLTAELPEERRAFSAAFVPVMVATHNKHASGQHRAGVRCVVDGGGALFRADSFHLFHEQRDAAAADALLCLFGGDDFLEISVV